MSSFSDDGSKVVDAGLDPVAQLEVGRRWLDAYNRRDADALVALADPRVALYPTKLPGNRDFYGGHDGVRRWMADLAAANAPQSIRVTDARCGPHGTLLVFGEVVFDGRSLSPCSTLMTLRGGKIVEARAFLSDEAELKSIGRIDD